MRKFYYLILVTLVALNTSCKENKYTEIEQEIEGLRAVKGKNGKWGFIDSKEQEVIPLKYDYVEHFQKGFAKVGVNGILGIIDKSGKTIIPIKEYTSIYFDGTFPVVASNNCCTGIVDKAGVEIVEFKYHEVGESNHIKYLQNTDLIKVKTDAGYGLVRLLTGEEVVSPQYDGIEKSVDGVIWVFEKWGDLGKRYGLIDINGNEIIRPKYEKIHGFNEEGLCRVENSTPAGNGWNKELIGYIDRGGTEIILPLYQSSGLENTDYKNGIDELMQGDDYIQFDTSRKEIKRYRKDLNGNVIWESGSNNFD